LLHNLGKETRHKFFWKLITCTNHSYQRRYTITRNRFFLYFQYVKFDLKWVISDFRAFSLETTKIILFERDKSKKLRSIVLGLKDAFYGKLGIYRYK
jgi:rhamnosyltransferase